jgi:DNA-binding LacI/PurR family transcriptional regulator
VRPTLADVARIAGVSAMSASAVLNGARTSSRVAAATRERIQAAAARLGYQPNAVARSLANRRTNAIGLYTGTGSLTADVPFGAQVLAGLQKGCAEFGKDLLLHGRFEQPERWGISYAELADGRLDGVVMLSAADAPLVATLAGSPLAVVAMVDAVPAVPSAIADEARGARLLIEHLAARGHRRVLWRDSVEREVDSVRRRHQGLLAAGRELGVEVVAGDLGFVPRPFTARERGLLRPGDPGRATAVVCFADYVCEALLEDALRLGWSVPGDLAIAGFDGIELVNQPRPWRRVTTIRCRWDRVAWSAVQLLSRRLDGVAVPATTTLPVELAVGDTT